MDLTIPSVVALNLSDQAEKMGISIDENAISHLLGLEVVKTVATRGTGVHELLDMAIDLASGNIEYRPKVLDYGKFINDIAGEISREIDKLKLCLPYGLSSRSLAILYLEGDPEITELIRLNDLRGRIAALIERYKERFNLTDQLLHLSVVRERHRIAAEISKEVQKFKTQKQLMSQRIWRLTTSASTGIPILLGAVAVLFSFMFYVGNFLSRLFEKLWQISVSPLLDIVSTFLFHETIFKKIFEWGFDAGILAALSVGIPYVLTFYFLLALLEDTGYLNSVAFLMDKVMHKIGLHGRAIMPMIAGAGCSVPAIIGTRVLSTKRERFIASALIVLIPCSARTAVIMGAVSLFVGWEWAIAVYAISFIVVVFSGFFLNKIMPGQSRGLVMEMFPFRAPSIKSIAKKTWFRFKDFVVVALPIVLVGSAVLGLLYETGWIWNLSKPLKPVVQLWLGLPAVAGLTLIFAVLRKELALQLLVALAIIQYGASAANLLNFMTKEQIFIYAVVNTIYLPCIASFAALGKELGWRQAIVISLFTISIAILIGGIAHRLIVYFKLL
jgi:ferrous iron transport protein B